MLLLTLLFVTFNLCCFKSNTSLRVPQKKNNVSTDSLRNDFVPNVDSAIKIAEKEWLSIYGENIYDKKPFKVELLGDSIWKVIGTIDPIDTTKTGQFVIRFGGVPTILIRKNDGKIISVGHGE